MVDTELQNGLTSIQQKLKLLLEKYAALQKENARIRIQKDNLKTQLKEKEKQIVQLAQQSDILKSGIRNWHPEQKKIFIKRIDQYLKEIDKCLAMINE